MAFFASLSSPVHFRNPNPIFSPKPAFRPVTVKPLPALPFVAADVNNTTIAIINGGSLASLVAALSLTNPEHRRKLQDEEVIKDYFNKLGFERWKKIYGETDDVNTVQRDIRLGHSKTVENVMRMLTDEGPLAGVTVCDAGCGTSCLVIPLANEGTAVTASDISTTMVAEAEKQAREQLDLGKEGLILPKFEVSDLESLGGKYDTVVCLDVLIHYPQSKVDGMIAHLALLAEKQLLESFAPKTFYYDILKRIREFFPGLSLMQEHPI